MKILGDRIREIKSAFLKQEEDAKVIVLETKAKEAKREALKAEIATLDKEISSGYESAKKAAPGSNPSEIFSKDISIVLPIQWKHCTNDDEVRSDPNGRSGDRDYEYPTGEIEISNVAFRFEYDAKAAEFESKKHVVIHVSAKEIEKPNALKWFSLDLDLKVREVDWANRAFSSLEGDFAQIFKDPELAEVLESLRKTFA